MSTVLSKFLFVFIAGISLQTLAQSSALTERFIENMTAVISAEHECGFSINQSTLVISMSTMGISAGDIEVGGRYRSQFENWVFRIKKLTATESQRTSYCRTVGVNLSAFFDSTGSESIPQRTVVSPKQQPKPAKPYIPIREDVRKVQSLLIELGYEPGPVDGKMGERTISAVRTFQRNSGLNTDGKVTTTIEKALRSQVLERERQYQERAAKTAQLSQKDAKNSDFNITEKVIERLQFYLDVKGLYVGPKNGIMNEKLNQAIQRFQASNRLSVDGKASQDLLKAVKNTIFK